MLLIIGAFIWAFLYLQTTCTYTPIYCPALVLIVFRLMLLTLLLTLCGLTGQKTHRGGLGLGGLVHEEAHPCFLYIVQPPFKRVDAGSTNWPLVQLIPSINYSV